MTAVINAIRRALLGTGSMAFTLVGSVLIGFGVHLFWIYVASTHGHTRDLLGAAADRFLGPRQAARPG